MDNFGEQILVICCKWKLFCDHVCDHIVFSQSHSKLNEISNEKNYMVSW